jgi:hypothetical protein
MPEVVGFVVVAFALLIGALVIVSVVVTGVKTLWSRTKNKEAIEVVTDQEPPQPTV